MREIKFRAWNKEREAWLHPKEFRIDGLGKVTWIFNPVGIDDGTVLLQYTGLKDKNGKEIYENDLVKLDNWEPKIYEVVFDRVGFCFRSSKDATFYNDCKYLEQGEVIGNVYENKDLL